MEYKYTLHENYEDFASGRVIYHMGGLATFPVRLTLELYERCLQYCEKKKDLCLYDCCCGGAYMLTVLGLARNDTLAELYGSDVDPASIKLAKDNMRLLTKQGLEKRRAELESLYQEYRKESHLQALHSMERLEKLLQGEPKTDIFERDALRISDLPFIPDIILTDVPYGNLASWNEDRGGATSLLEALSGVCSRDTVIGICMDKKQKIKTEIYQRLEKQILGKRKFELYKKRIFGTLTCAREYEKQGRLADWVQLFLRGDGKNIPLADGLAENNFRFAGLVPIRLTDLNVAGGVPEYITEPNDITWFHQEIDTMVSAIRKGWDMPPMIVHYHDGIYEPFDGRHRNAALRKLGREEAMAAVVVNTEKDYNAFLGEGGR